MHLNYATRPGPILSDHGHLNQTGVAFETSYRLVVYTRVQLKISGRSRRTPFTFNCLILGL